MRRLFRVPLAVETRLELHDRQKLCTDKAAARTAWTTFRASKDSKPLMVALATMAGKTERCFYCGDSRGADVDHYNAVSRDPGSTFSWSNLQLVCTPCNRQKARAVTWDGSRRIFVDPTVDDPWDHFVLVTQSGLIAPRSAANGTVDEVGRYTLEKLSVLNYDAITDMRRRVIRRIYNALDLVAANGDTIESRRALIWAAEDDFFGIGRWFVMREGRLEDRLSGLKADFPRLWRRFVVTASRG
jgi:uncharacterized protein (TIGR02646 family)